MKLLALCMATDNREAFSRLVVAYQDQLRRFIFNMTGGNIYLTDDIAQETFLKAWFGIKSFQGLSGFRTWLFRIAINEYVSYRRKNARTVLSENEPVQTDVSNEMSDIKSIEANIDVATVLNHLPDAERIVTLLFYLEDLSIKQICKITSMPEGTVKSHLNRARHHMAAFIKSN